MLKYFKLSGYSLFIFIILNLMFSCKNGDSEKKTAENSVTVSDSISPDIKQEETKAMAIAGTLDNLWIESSMFNTLPDKQLVFSFRFEPKDILTLHGWVCKGLICTGSYETDPIIKLKNSPASTVSFGPSIYFGNVILHRSEIKRIQKNFSDKYDYVVFIPEIKGEFIYYSIHVTNDDPSKPIKALITVDTGEDANPSPPKEY